MSLLPISESLSLPLSKALALTATHGKEKVKNNLRRRREGFQVFGAMFGVEGK